MIEVRLVLVSWRKGLRRKHKGVFWNAGSLYLGMCGGYMSDYIGKNASKCADKISLDHV